jgi:hypothetical protein
MELAEAARRPWCPLYVMYTAQPVTWMLPQAEGQGAGSQHTHRAQPISCPDSAVTDESRPFLTLTLLLEVKG